MLCILNLDRSCEECLCRLFLESEEPKFCIGSMAGDLREFYVLQYKTAVLTNSLAHCSIRIEFHIFFVLLLSPFKYHS